jgi:iron complex outermembrane recepter protein
MTNRPIGITAVASAVLRVLSLCAPTALSHAATAPVPATDVKPLLTGVPAQPLEQALEAFARQTGWQLIYVSEVLGTQLSHAVPAGLGAADALGLMLEGTGLKFEYLTPHSVRIMSVVAEPSPTGAAGDDELREVIVTANRRVERLQDVPITVQVLSGEQLKELELQTFNDMTKYTTNVTNSGNGPGTGNIFIRGLGSPGTGNQGQAIIAPFPNVALYLDEQSMQFPTRNNDVYMVDLERVEILEGPQGTLFGGGAQAGVIRYLTKKPRTDVFQADVTAGYGLTTGGGPNTSANAILNLPLLDNKLGIRAVGFYDRRGGYIANVPGQISFDFPSATPGGSRQVSPVATNVTLVGPDTNPVTYSGFRLSALYRFTDEWDLLIQQSYQQMQADGYFYAYPLDSSGNALQPHQITAFTPAYTNDHYDSTAWTLNGKLGELKAIYAGSFMRRDIDAQQDYSNYLRSGAGSYYDCIGMGAGYFNEVYFQQLQGKALQCYPPVGAWHDQMHNQHQSHEVRISTPESARARLLVGGYWEKFVIDDQLDFNYLGIPQCSTDNLASALAGGPACVAAVGPLPGAYAGNPALRENMNNAFGDDVQRGYKQFAFFTSIDFDLIPRVLTLTAGTRYYQYDEFETGSTWGTLSSNPLVVNHPNGACTYAAENPCGFPINLDKKESGFRSRANLAWHMTPDVMAFYTYSEGFRPGGFNRTPSLAGQPPVQEGVAYYCGGESSIDPRCQPGGDLYELNKTSGTAQMIKPYSYRSDNLINQELGVKGEFLNHRLRVNATAYLMHWDNVQSSAQGFSSAVLLFTNIVNGPSYTIKGLELQWVARMAAGLTMEGAAAWNSSKQSSVPCLKSTGVTPITPNNPTPAGQCISVVAGQTFALGVLESSLPYSPPFMFNLRAHYDWRIGDFHPFAWAGVSHNGASSNEPKNFPDGNAPEPVPSTVLRYTIPAYTVYDAGLGVDKDHWSAQFTGSNLSNSNAATNISSAQLIKATIPMRPRVVMLRVSYSL